MSLTTTPRFAPGSLVRARGRDWVVLPSTEPAVLRLRPLTGTEDDAIGLFIPLEGRDVHLTEFDLPDPAQAGDALAGLLLTDAARLRLRAGAAPFRSLGQISCRPRPYQFVPLIMALRLDPVRLLIADDVGVGKTIEAALIARELLDRGLAKRLAVICSAHLCDQWERELADKFGIDAKVVQPSRIGRLERSLPRHDLSIYQHFPHLILSVDYIKSPRNRAPFLQNAPDLVIVDEAHIATRPHGDSSGNQQQRYQLIRDLAADESRHLILVTATPHSGIEESFRSLLGLLKPEFDLPGTSGNDEIEDIDRRALLPYVVQRRRQDVVRWLGTETPFPTRSNVDAERTYVLSDAYRELYEEVREFCQEMVRAGSGIGAQQQRVRYWGAIALLRCLLSSPGAACTVLQARRERQGWGNDSLSASAEEEAVNGLSADEVDDVYKQQVIAELAEDEVADYVPAAPLEESEPTFSSSEKRRLGSFIKRALDLHGTPLDHKLAKAADIVDELLRTGYHPIVFCHYIATAEYLEAELSKLLGGRFRNLRVKAVTGKLSDDERRAVVDELVNDPVRVLVATDCLSEGINLQEHFDAVLHYDLPWNPNRLEQRDGRIDRFGQPKPEVRSIVLYGADSRIDQTVMDVLVRKVRTIRQQLGVTVTIPFEQEQVSEVLINTELMHQRQQGTQLELGLSDPRVSRLHRAMDESAQREQGMRSFFAQAGIKPDEVAQELEATDPVLGDPATVQHFIANAVQRLGGSLQPTNTTGVFELNPGSLMERLVSQGYDHWPRRVAFDATKEAGAPVLGRTHPIVTEFCDVVLGSGLASGMHAAESDPRFARTGATYTSAVTRRTVVLALRLRYLLREATDNFAEEVRLVAFEREAGQLVWLEPLESAGRDLLSQATSVAIIEPAERERQVRWALDFLRQQPDWWEPITEGRKADLQATHTRLRRLTRAPRLTVKPHEPPDILGCYVLVPRGER